MRDLPSGVTRAEEELAAQRDRVWVRVLRSALLRAQVGTHLRRRRWELLAFRRRLDELRVARGIAANPLPRPLKVRRRTPQTWVRLVRR